MPNAPAHRSPRPFKRLARVSVLGLSAASLLGGFTVLAGVSPAGAAAFLYVAPNGSDVSNNCNVQSLPCQTLSHAYTKASASGTTIELAGGTFIGDINLSKNVNIVGSGPYGSLDVLNTTISGNGGEVGIDVTAGHTVNISNLVINDATAESVVNEGTLNLTNVVVGWDTTVPPFASAGIFNDATLTMDGGQVIGNVTKTVGGGLFNEAGTATFHDVSFTHNSAPVSFGEGGGIFNFDGTVKLTGTTSLHNNTAAVWGGGIESCAINGAVTTLGGGVVDTSNSPNNFSTFDPEGDC